MYTSTSNITPSNEAGRWQAWTRADWIFTECVLKLWNFLPQDGMNAESLGTFFPWVPSFFGYQGNMTSLQCELQIVEDIEGIQGVFYDMTVL